MYTKNLITLLLCIVYLTTNVSFLYSHPENIAKDSFFSSISKEGREGVGRLGDAIRKGDGTSETSRTRIERLKECLGRFLSADFRFSRREVVIMGLAVAMEACGNIRYKRRDAGVDTVQGSEMGVEKDAGLDIKPDRAKPDVGPDKAKQDVKSDVSQDVKPDTTKPDTTNLHISPIKYFSSKYKKIVFFKKVESSVSFFCRFFEKIPCGVYHLTLFAKIQPPKQNF